MQSLIYYFAYASNLNETQFKIERKITFFDAHRAYLHGYEFVFDTKSTLYPGYSVANVQEKKDAITEGLLYHMPKEELKKLDVFEIGYDKKMVTVITEDNVSHEAYIYKGKPTYFIKGIPPSPEYIRRIITGGEHIFSPTYKEKILKAAQVNPPQ